MSTAKPPAPRKRNGKRKRRLASPSPSSSDSSDSSSDEASRKAPLQRVPLIKSKLRHLHLRLTSRPSLSSSSDSENDDAPHVVGAPSSHVATFPNNARRFSDPEPPAATGRRRPPSPPPAADAPPFLPPEGSSDRGQEEQALRNRSRQFWMASVADAFGDDLE
ncbi:hypothetical protein F5148DRAFT_713545 [Russula earlei]|uniref:Uncharacterized protein n=1 Tax=Russula earlei TaxID=71964 RepID=A0ACC0TUA9_9AGAM|nr:hypothetical protein F5148DRAFT_713545 [Russula earlei]